MQRLARIAPRAALSDTAHESVVATQVASQNRYGMSRFADETSVARSCRPCRANKFPTSAFSRQSKFTAGFNLEARRTSPSPTHKAVPEAGPQLFTPLPMALQLAAEQEDEKRAAREAQCRLVRLQAVARHASARSVARSRRHRTRREKERRAAMEAARERAEAETRALMAAARAAAATEVLFNLHRVFQSRDSSMTRAM